MRIILNSAGINSRMYAGYFFLDQSSYYSCMMRLTRFLNKDFRKVQHIYLVYWNRGTLCAVTQSLAQAHQGGYQEGAKY